MTEEEIEQELVTLMSEPGPFFFQCASQNIDRIITFYNACRSTRRQFIIDQFTANVLHDLRILGYSLPSPGVGSDAMHVFNSKTAQGKTTVETGHERTSRFSRWHASRPQVMAMADRVAMLVRPAMLTDLRKMPSLSGGQMVFSMPHAFRETPGQKRLEHLMLARGTTIVPLHTGGHARIDELNKLIATLQPKSVRLVNDLQPDVFSKLPAGVVALHEEETVEI
jgi:mRNA degradation ribonuclease J1/J2